MHDAADEWHSPPSIAQKLHAYVGAHVQSAVVGTGDTVGDGVVTPPSQAQHISDAVKSSSSRSSLAHSDGEAVYHAHDSPPLSAASVTESVSAHEANRRCTRMSAVSLRGDGGV